MPNIGVTPNVKTRMKILMFYVADLVIAIVWFGTAMIIANFAFPPSRVLVNYGYQLINLVFAIWLVITPYHNPGKKNYELIMSDMLMSGHHYQSFSYYEFDTLSDLLQIGGLKQNAFKEQARE